MQHSTQHNNVALALFERDRRDRRSHVSFAQWYPANRGRVEHVAEMIAQGHLALRYVRGDTTISYDGLAPVE